ncbi:MAG: hypothetical protein F6K54_32695, partial [Okeania sp. SIO3B5]|nr:hypothetical protein [Okeania sp. SIO3B5]
MNVKSRADAENSTSKIWGDKSSDNYQVDSGLYELPRQIEEAERLEPERSIGTISKGENATAATATIDGGGGRTKKLASQLELLKEVFYEYVGEHRGRLEQRLDENKQFTQKF